MMQVSRMSVSLIGRFYWSGRAVKSQSYRPVGVVKIDQFRLLLAGRSRHFTIAASTRHVRILKIREIKRCDRADSSQWKSFDHCHERNMSEEYS
jgi:hypothetical protein